MKLTQDMKDKLIAAIKNAVSGGAYYDRLGDQPCCVVGRLGFECGVSLEDLKLWDFHTGGASCVIAELPDDGPGVDKISQYKQLKIPDEQVEAWSTKLLEVFPFYPYLSAVKELRTDSLLECIQRCWDFASTAVEGGIDRETVRTVLIELVQQLPVEQ